MSHTCHNPNCGQPLPAHLVSHSSAWFALPKKLRDNIWRTYRAGQEDDKQPTMAYIEALEGCINWWREHETICRIPKRDTVSRERIHAIGAKANPKEHERKP